MREVFIAIDNYGSYIPNTSAYNKNDSDKSIQNFGYKQDEYEIISIYKDEYLNLVQSLDSFKIKEKS